MSETIDGYEEGSWTPETPLSTLRLLPLKMQGRNR
jgi:hypothetical protein